MRKVPRRGKPVPRVFDDVNHTYKSRRQERRVAEMIGGFRQPGSGAFKGMKGDIKTDDFLLEAKRTGNRSLTLKAEWLVKIDGEAEVMGKKPGLVVEFEVLPVGMEKNWIIIPLTVFRELIQVGD